jgi:hypothetical protein
MLNSLSSRLLDGIAHFFVLLLSNLPFLFLRVYKIRGGLVMGFAEYMDTRGGKGRAVGRMGGWCQSHVNHTSNAVVGWRRKTTGGA